MEANKKDLIVWWNSLDKDLKCVLKNAIGIKTKPTVEDIVKMINLESIDASHFDLVNISPLFRLTKLKKAIFNNTSIESLDCFKNSKDLEYLDITFSLVKTLKPIWNLEGLKVLKCKRTPKLLYEEVKQFVDSHPHCKIFWDYETDQHWLDFINLDQQEGTNQDPDDTTSKPTQYENKQIKLEKLIENKIRNILNKLNK
jgi:hypothetical protein